MIEFLVMILFLGIQALMGALGVCVSPVLPHPGEKKFGSSPLWLLSLLETQPDPNGPKFYMQFTFPLLSGATQAHSEP